MIESLAATVRLTASWEATGSGVPSGAAVMVTTSGTDSTCVGQVGLIVCPWPSSMTTVSVQAWAVPVALAGAVHVGVEALASEKLPLRRPPAQAALQA